MAGLIERGIQFVLSAKDGLSAVFNQAGKSVKDFDKSVGDTGASVAAAEGRFQSLAGALRALAAAAAAKFFISANIDAQALAKSLEVVTGSSEGARKELEFIRDTASRLGLPLEQAGQAYIGLAAAAKGTALEGQAARDIFTAVASAMGQLGKSSADTEGALLALQQMISKGKVSAEELRGQLGERMPGAFQAAARAMGLTTAELDKLMAAGQITAEDLLPKLAAELNKTYGDPGKVSTFTAAWERLKTALSLAASEAGESSKVFELLTWGMGKLTSLIGFVSVGFTTVAEKARAAGIAVGAFTDMALGRISWSKFKEEVSGAFAAADASIAAAADRAFGLGKATGEAGAQGAKAGQALQDGMDKAGKAAGGAATQVDKLGAAAGRAQASTASMLIAIAKERDAIEASSKMVEKLTAAKAAQNAAAEALAKLAGDEAGQLKAAATAALEKSAAADAEAVSAQRLAELKRQEIALFEQAGASRAEDLRVARDAIGVLEAEAAQRRAVAEQARVEAVAAQVAAQSYGNQADSMDGLAVAVERAGQKIAELRAADAAGTAAAKDLLQVREELRKSYEQINQAVAKGAEIAPALLEATGRLRDEEAALTETVAKGAQAATQLNGAQREEAALKARLADAARDEVEAIDRKIAAQSRALEIEKAESELVVMTLERRIALAKARGDEADVQRLQVAIYEQERRSILAAADAKYEEAAALREKARAKEIEAKATGDYSDAEKAEAAAMRDAADMADLASKKLQLNAQAKQDAIHEAERLAARERTLADILHEVGATGTGTMEDVRRAISEAANGEELAGLEANLRKAFEAGILSGSEFNDLLAEIKAQIAGVQQQAKGKGPTIGGINFDDLFAKFRDDLGRLKSALMEIYGDNLGMVQQILQEYEDWLREKGFFGGARPGIPIAPAGSMSASVSAPGQSAAGGLTRIDPADLREWQQVVKAALDEHADRLMGAVAEVAARPIALTVDGKTLARTVSQYQDRIGALSA